MKYESVRKGLVLGIIFLFVGAGVIPSLHGIGNGDKSIKPILKNNILYVGGSGPGNYTKIQDAIDNASDGDTVFVYAYSSPYYENVIVNKSIDLIGEDKETTVIDGNYSNNSIIFINANFVKIKGFTIIHGSFNGIGLLESVGCSITGNIITNNNDGIFLLWSDLNTIISNIISNNNDGIILSGSTFILIFKNNFIDNEQDAYFWNSHLNRWILNYWDEPQILPKLIHGKIIGGGGWGMLNLRISWFNIDWRPALRPYDI